MAMTKMNSLDTSWADADEDWPKFLKGLTDSATRVVELHKKRNKKPTTANRKRIDDKRMLAYAYAQFVLIAAKKNREKIIDEFIRELKLKPKSNRPLTAIVAKYLSLGGKQQARKYRSERVRAIKTLIAKRIEPLKVARHKLGIRALAHEWNHEPEGLKSEPKKAASALSNLEKQLWRQMRPPKNTTIRVELRALGEGKFRLIRKL